MGRDPLSAPRLRLTLLLELKLSAFVGALMLAGSNPAIRGVALADLEENLNFRVLKSRWSSYV